MANNDFTESQRNTIWTKYFGNSQNGIDSFGRSVSKSNFECDHIWPKSKNGPTNVNNGQPLNSLSNEEKSDKLSGIVNGKRFEVTGVGKMTVNGKLVTK